MNKGKQELLDKAIDVRYEDLKNVPDLCGIYIIPQRKLHDSGYKMMYVIGHDQWNKLTKSWNYYLLGTFSDVVDFESFYSKIPFNDLHLDIDRDGIIHIWSKTNLFKCTHMVSTCMFESVGRQEDLNG